jgi:oligoribonuclease NrnB/cAMP/cGMP phosphodiesterase (DHH superfamily)
VKVASPVASAGNIEVFKPHLLLHSDNDGLGSQVLAGVLCRVTVLYTDGMDARITTLGEVREARDMSTEDLLRVVDAASDLAGE